LNRKRTGLNTASNITQNSYDESLKLVRRFGTVKELVWRISRSKHASLEKTQDCGPDPVLCENSAEAGSSDNWWIDAAGGRRLPPENRPSRHRP